MMIFIFGIYSVSVFVCVMNMIFDFWFVIFKFVKIFSAKKSIDRIFHPKNAFDLIREKPNFPFVLFLLNPRLFSAVNKLFSIKIIPGIILTFDFFSCNIQHSPIVFFFLFCFWFWHFPLEMLKFVCGIWNFKYRKK